MVFHLWVASYKRYYNKIGFDGWGGTLIELFGGRHFNNEVNQIWFLVRRYIFEPFPRSWKDTILYKKKKKSQLYFKKLKKLELKLI